MVSAMVDVPGGVTRDEHIAACIGCQYMMRVNPETGHFRDITCYEMADNARYAAMHLLDLFKTYRHPCRGGHSGSDDFEHDDLVGYPTNLVGMVDAVMKHVPAGSIDLGCPQPHRWIQPHNPDRWVPGGWPEGTHQYEYVVRCQCRSAPTSFAVSLEAARHAGTRPCGICGETSPPELVGTAV